MLEQAIDFREESEALYKIIEPISEDAYDQKTQFKDWTINDVLAHLHMWNWAADHGLKDPDKFDQFLNTLITEMATNTLRQFETKWLDGLKGKKLLQEWRTYFTEMAGRFEPADPKKRVKWAGPDMSVKSSISARLMETWAHGQEIFDHLGVVRENKDRIKNIAVLGMNTFGWTFKNRGIDAPSDKPYVKLTAPSGEIWEWEDPSADNFVEGQAEDFCQVVTQVRNIGDTSLKVVGETATKWMSIAQCFAGGPEDPPAPGVRFTRKT
jgi:uncharacterized protein (TIGR03084 family)